MAAGSTASGPTRQKAATADNLRSTPLWRDTVSTGQAVVRIIVGAPSTGRSPPCPACCGAPVSGARLHGRDDMPVSHGVRQDGLVSGPDPLTLPDMLPSPDVANLTKGIVQPA